MVNGRAGEGGWDFDETHGLTHHSCLQHHGLGIDDQMGSAKATTLIPSNSITCPNW